MSERESGEPTSSPNDLLSSQKTLLSFSHNEAFTCIAFGGVAAQLLSSLSPNFSAATRIAETASSCSSTSEAISRLSELLNSTCHGWRSATTRSAKLPSADRNASRQAMGFGPIDRSAYSRSTPSTTWKPLAHSKASSRSSSDWRVFVGVNAHGLRDPGPALRVQPAQSSPLHTLANVRERGRAFRGIVRRFYGIAVIGIFNRFVIAEDVLPQIGHTFPEPERRAHFPKLGG